MSSEGHGDGERRRSPRHLRLRLAGTRAEVTERIERTLSEMARDGEDEYVVYVPIPDGSAVDIADIIDGLPDGVDGDVVDDSLTPLDRKAGGRGGSNGPPEVEP